MTKRRISSRDLFHGAHELVIDHRGKEYRLLLTRNDKLILNK
jgi:hemin uptake protein HemP